jgi:hypothetical protein
MGLERLELSTPALSEQCSNQLSYRPEESIKELPLQLFKDLMCVTGLRSIVTFRLFVEVQNNEPLLKSNSP